MVVMDIEQLYTLDTCSHRFCRPCLSAYMHESLLDKPACEVTCPVCEV